MVGSYTFSNRAARFYGHDAEDGWDDLTGGGATAMPKGYSTADGLWPHAFHLPVEAAGMNLGGGILALKSTETRFMDDIYMMSSNMAEVEAWNWLPGGEDAAAETLRTFPPAEREEILPSIHLWYYPDQPTHLGPTPVPGGEIVRIDSEGQAMLRLADPENPGSYQWLGSHHFKGVTRFSKSGSGIGTFKPSGSESSTSGQWINGRWRALDSFLPPDEGSQSTRTVWPKDINDSGVIFASVTTSDPQESEEAGVFLPIKIKVPEIKWNNDTNEVQEDQFLVDATVFNSGAYVLLNSDDYNYTGIPDMDDVDENGALIAIEGPNGELAETDLLPLVLSSVPGFDEDAKITLDIPTEIRIWLQPNRSERVVGVNDPNHNDPTELHASEDTILYVEGVNIGEADLKFIIKIGQMTSEPGGRLKVTVFDINGPTSVPALGTYEYRVQGSDGEWLDPHNGNIYFSGDGDKSKREIQWGHTYSQGMTGAVIYSPIKGLEWGREIDIVQMILASDPNVGEHEVRARNPDVGWEEVGIEWDNPGQVPPSGDQSAAITSSSLSPSIFRAWVQVSSLRGPSRGGIQHRGVDRLQFGFVQRAKWDVKRAIYPNGTIRASTLEGMGWHLDRFLEERIPWIEDEGYDLANSNLANRRTFFQSSDNDPLFSGDLVFHYEFRRGDTLANSGPRMGMMFTDSFAIDGEKPTSFQLEGHFDLSVAVKTDSGDQIADSRYFILANQTQPWRYTAFGRVVDDEIHPPNLSIGGRSIGQLWGAYAFANFDVLNDGTHGELRRIVGFDESHFIGAEYPFLIGEPNLHEVWNTK